MNIREIIDLLEERGDSEFDELNRHSIKALFGSELKPILSRINLAVIDDEDLGSVVLDVIAGIHARQHRPLPDAIARMYGVDDRKEVLDLQQTVAEVEKTRAQAERIRSGR